MNKAFQYDDRQLNAWLALRECLRFGDDEPADYCLDAPDWLLSGSMFAGEYNPVCESCVHREYL